MMIDTQLSTQLLDWGSASSPRLGAQESGDRVAILPFGHGTLIAAIDGHGDGSQAALAATVAADVLRQHPGDALTELLERCHARLVETTGAVLGLASFDPRSGSMAWLGVGNVQGTFLRARPSLGLPARERLVTSPGLLGRDKPPLRTSVLQLARNDLVILTTEGVRAGFIDELDRSASADHIARFVLNRFSKGTEDASVVVARYLGGSLLEVSVPVLHESDVLMARKAARDQAYGAGLLESDTEALAMAVSELAWNILTHAGSGEILLGGVEEGDQRGVLVVASDSGSGIMDPDLMIEDGYTSVGGALGLVGARQLVDTFEITSASGKGTTITMKKWAR